MISRILNPSIISNSTTRILYNSILRNKYQYINQHVIYNILNYNNHTYLPRRYFSSDNEITITFIEDDEEIEIDDAEIGETILDIGLENDIDLEAACGGELACSTCHVIIEDDSYYDLFPEKTEEEEDMLDLAWGVEDNSRLCCQLKLTKEMNGMRIKVPEDSYNMM